MIYWISLVFLFIVFVFFVFIIWKEKPKSDESESNIFFVLKLIAYTILLIFILLCIDIPSALNGGEEMYVNELPRTIYSGTVIQQTYSDNKELNRLRGCNWNAYEQYGSYRIRYTKLTKYVLDVEKLD